MTKRLSLFNLIHTLQKSLDGLPEHRKGKNTTYLIRDAALGAFSVFFMQSPSFLAHQENMQRNEGRNNASSLFGRRSSPG